MEAREDVTLAEEVRTLPFPCRNTEIAWWSNGRTADFDSVGSGSNPGRAVSASDLEGSDARASTGLENQRAGRKPVGSTPVPSVSLSIWKVGRVVMQRTANPSGSRPRRFDPFTFRVVKT